MDTPFTLDIWSDVICPFCYLGAKNLDQAVARFEHRGQVVIRHRAFELDPRAVTTGLPLDELVAKKYSMPIEQAKVLHQRLEAQAATLGLTWSLTSAQPTNTFDAHRLIALASQQGLADQMSDRLFGAYFSEGSLISDRTVLSTLASEIGVTNVDDLWLANALADDVRADEHEALERGISGVPSILVDGRFMIVGAQSVEQMTDVLARAWARRVTP